MVHIIGLSQLPQPAWHYRPAIGSKLSPHRPKLRCLKSNPLKRVSDQSTGIPSNKWWPWNEDIIMTHDFFGTKVPFVVVIVVELSMDAAPLEPVIQVCSSLLVVHKWKVKSVLNLLSKNIATGIAVTYWGTSYNNKKQYCRSTNSRAIWVVFFYVVFVVLECKGKLTFSNLWSTSDEPARNVMTYSAEFWAITMACIMFKDREIKTANSCYWVISPALFSALFLAALARCFLCRTIY